MSAPTTPLTPGPRRPAFACGFGGAGCDLPDAWPSTRPLLVGERLNALGSRRCRQLLLDGNYDGLIAIGREQLELGAHALDVCVTFDRGSGLGARGSAAGVEGQRGESARMVALVTRLAAAVNAPIFIDSADATVLRTALACIGARGVANSVTLAHGHRDIEALAPIVRDRAGRLVVLCIDETGMAISSEGKLEIVHRVRELTKRLGLDPHVLIVDPLMFPVAIGPAERRRAAAEAIAAVRQIKASWPETATILGISDVSFGLPPRARPVMNAVLLHHAVEAGLDMAIVNVGTRRGYQDLSSEERELAEDLLFDRRPDALERLVAVL